MTTDSLFSSVVWLVHHQHEMNTTEMASLYGIPHGFFENWLYILGFTEDAVEELRWRKPFSQGKCPNCGIILDKAVKYGVIEKAVEEFCTEKCKQQYTKRKAVRTLMSDTALIPTTIRGVFYDTKREKGVKLYESK